uniref:Uncharacterized protein n=1 Tax=Arundo donax TaxID=35708 RepID=A0A0A8ZMX0_ARUDO
MKQSWKTTLKWKSHWWYGDVGTMLKACRTPICTQVLQIFQLT